MKLKIDNCVAVFLRQFIKGLFIFGSLNVFNFCIRQLFNERSINISIPWSFGQIIFASFIISFMMLSGSLYIAKAVSMDNKELFVEMITRALKRMKWKLQRQSGEELIFISSYLDTLWKERIIVRFTDTELQICGPREAVERAIRYANFPYGAFEISTFHINEECRN